MIHRKAYHKLDQNQDLGKYGNILCPKPGSYQGWPQLPPKRCNFPGPSLKGAGVEGVEEEAKPASY